MEIVLAIVTPVFGVLLLGYFAARLGWFDDHAIHGLSLFVFNVAIPPLLFRNMALAELPDPLPWGLLLAYYLGTFAVFLLGMLGGGLIFKQRLGEQGMLGFNAAYANSVLIGIPLVLTAFGDQASVPLFLIIALHSPLMMPTMSLILEMHRGQGAALWRIPGNTLRGLARNPVIIGLLTGVAFNLLQWPIPGPVDSIARMLGQAALPCALFAMGASLSRYRIAGNITVALAGVALKLVVHPLLVGMLAFWVFEVPRLWASVAVLIAALPTGVNTYLFAQRYGVGIAASTTAIFLSTAISVLSLSLLLFFWLPGEPY